MKFFPRVKGCDKQSIQLMLADHYWDLADLAPGLKVQITKFEQDKMYYLEGVVVQAQKEASPNLVIQHHGQVLRAQRRLFQRSGLQKKFWLEKITLPNGKISPHLRATLLNISPGGIGFKLRCLLPRGTQFEVKDLFDPLIPELEGIQYFHSVLWSRGNWLGGYRHGAIFQFPSEHEQNQLLWVIDQLQISRLSWYYHSLIQSRRT